MVLKRNSERHHNVVKPVANGSEGYYCLPQVSLVKVMFTILCNVSLIKGNELATTLFLVGGSDVIVYPATDAHSDGCRIF